MVTLDCHLQKDISVFPPTTASLVPRIVFEMLNKYLLNTCMQVQRYVSV